MARDDRSRPALSSSLAGAMATGSVAIIGVVTFLAGAAGFFVASSLFVLVVAAARLVVRR